MRVAIMQPYFLPYIGYWQLIAAADVFVIYDNIQYTKKGWINRNRMLVNGSPALFTLPLQDGHAEALVDQRLIAPFDHRKLLRRFEGAYRRAPHYEETLPLLTKIIYQDEDNLFQFLLRSVMRICIHLGISTWIRQSSGITIDHSLKAQDKVIAICKALKADEYLNASGGVELYDTKAFRRDALRLRFIRALPLEYPQLGHPFVPWLSIIDVLMFNPLEKVQHLVHNHYEVFTK